MKNILLLLFFFIIVETISAQTGFQKIFKGPDSVEGEMAEQTMDGGYIIVGGSLVVKTDTGGHILWSKRYWGPNLKCAHQTSDGGFIMAGQFYQGNPNYYDGFVMKTDSIGNVIWSNSFGQTNNEFFYFVEETSDSGYILSGAAADSSNNYGLSLVKIDGVGNQLWSKCFRYSLENKVRQTRDGGYIIAGLTYDGCVSKNGCLIKTDSFGNLLWTKDYCDTYLEEFSFTDIRQTADGGYIISGTAQVPQTIFNADLLLIKTDSLGSIIWQKVYAGNHWGTSAYFSIQQTNDGGYAVGGFSGDFGATYCDAILIRTDTAGNLLWSKVYGRAGGNNKANSVTQTADRGYLLGGYIIPAGGTSNDKYFYLIKTDSLGNSGCREADAFPSTWQPTIHDSLTTSVDSAGENFYPITFNVTNAGTEYDFCSFILSSPEYLSGVDFLYLYPNPSNGNFTISFAEEMFKATIKIYNVFGEEVYSAAFNGKEKTIENKLIVGVYFIEVSNEKDRWMRKIIIQ